MDRIARLQTLEDIPHPPAPWEMQGQLWMGSFKADVPLELPTGLKHFLDPNALIVTIVRYQAGTLRYDELVFGTLVRLGSKIGIYVDCIWVDSLESVWGGRRIWGLPKNMAQFTWQGSTLSVSDDLGAIATISVDTSPARLPSTWLPTPMPGVGQLENGQWLYTVGQLWGRFGSANMKIESWATRFGYRPLGQAVFGFGVKPFRMRVPAAQMLNV